MRASARFATVAALWLALSAHVGSPDVWFDGMAGPYPVRVLVRPPGVVPGLADIVVRVRGDAAGARDGPLRVTVAPALGGTGPEGEPPADEAHPVTGSPGTFTAQLWLMTRGAYRITVTVAGKVGTGTVIVPVMATATERLAMPRFTALLLLGAALFLLAGLISIVGAGVRESLLPPGEPAPAERRGRARIAMAVATVVALMILLGGWTWWRAVDRVHRARLDRPWASTATVTARADGTRALVFEITDSLWRRRTDSTWLAQNREGVAASIVPDHGKVMHMFVIRDSSLTAFAHLHPVTKDAYTFTTDLPDLPVGRYRVYADIVEESGAEHTIVAALDLVGTGVKDPLAAASTLSGTGQEGDEGWWTGDPSGRLRGDVSVLDPVTSLHWILPGTIRAGDPIDIGAEVTDVHGAPVRLEPYLGMAGHAVVARPDGAVYIHLHPQGTISMASQRQLALPDPADPRVDHRDGPAMNNAPAGTLSFPYAFPRPGLYRIWVQVRRAGRVLTAAHDIEVL